MAGGEKESVHLERWATGTTADANILEEMATVRAMVSQALEERAKAGIKVRQPLASLTTKTSVSEELAEVIKDEVNVKEVMVRAETDGIILDTVITPELKREGQYRDLLRAVQEARKKAGLKPGEEMMLTLDLPAEWKDVAKEKESELMRTTFADAIQCSELSDVEPTKIEDAEIKVLVVKK